MKSMTGYGECARNVRGTKIAVQIRSLNHRHLDLQLRVPREYLSFEEEIRKVIRTKISRGRIDLFIHRSRDHARTRRLDMDEDLLGQYLVSVKQAKKKFHLSGEVSVSFLSRLPDLFHVREMEADASTERPGVLRVLSVAVRKLEGARAREGRQLRHDMETQIRHLRKIATALARHAEEAGTRVQKAPGGHKNSEHSLRLDGAAVDPAIMTSKGDINEEVVRLQSHVTALGRMLGEKEPVGKKIDFLLQEIQRELNTISSKAPQLSVVRYVLDGKERVEKIREQTQNIE